MDQVFCLYLDDRYINGTNLVINNVKGVHEGNYTCKAVFRKCSHIEKLQIGVTVNKGKAKQAWATFQSVA